MKINSYGKRTRSVSIKILFVILIHCIMMSSCSPLKQSDISVQNRTDSTTMSDTSAFQREMSNRESDVEPCETEEEYCEEPDTYEIGCEIVPVEPYLIIRNVDERYGDYSITQSQCSESMVGEVLGEMKVMLNWSDRPDETYNVTATVYAVVGRDREVSLCCRYNETEGLPIDDGYYYLNNDWHRFETLTDMMEGLAIPKTESIGETVYYYKRTQYSYCDRFVLSDGLPDVIMSYLLASDGKNVGDGSSFYELSSVAEERATLELHCDGVYMQIEIVDSGYVYCSAFGGHLFEIGRDNAREILALVQSGEPVGYVWNEEYSEWYTICEEDEIRENPPKTFLEMLALRGLEDELIPERKVIYLSGRIKPAPPYFLLDDDLLTNLADILSSLDGDLLTPEDEVGPAYECVKLKVSNGVGDAREIHIFSAGYISFGGFDYFVGLGNTEKLISIVVLEGVPADGYVWNETTAAWEKNTDADLQIEIIETDCDTTRYDTSNYDTEYFETIEIETVTETMIEWETETRVEGEMG